MLGRDLKECGPNGNPCDRRIAKVLCCLFEVHRSRRNKMCHDAVGESGDNVGLERYPWYVLQNRRQHGRARGVPANTDYDLGLKLVDDGCGSENGARQVEKRLQPGGQTDAIQRTNLHKL